MYMYSCIPCRIKNWPNSLPPTKKVFPPASYPLKEAGDGGGGRGRNEGMKVYTEHISSPIAWKDAAFIARFLGMPWLGDFRGRGPDTSRELLTSQDCPVSVSYHHTFYYDTNHFAMREVSSIAETKLFNFGYGTIFFPYFGCPPALTFSNTSINYNLKNWN